MKPGGGGVPDEGGAADGTEKRRGHAAHSGDRVGRHEVGAVDRAGQCRSLGRQDESGGRQQQQNADERAGLRPRHDRRERRQRQARAHERHDHQHLATRPAIDQDTGEGPDETERQQRDGKDRGQSRRRGAPARVEDDELGERDLSETVSSLPQALPDDQTAERSVPDAPGRGPAGHRDHLRQERRRSAAGSSDVQGLQVVGVKLLTGLGPELGDRRRHVGIHVGAL